MKKHEKRVQELIDEILSEYEIIREAAKDDTADGNPFAAAGGDAKEEEPAADKGGEEEKDDTKKPAPQEPQGLQFNFNIDRVKKYNKGEFLSNTAVAKKITKDGIIATVMPDETDILVNFDDITESVRSFFKQRSKK